VASGCERPGTYLAFPQASVFSPSDVAFLRCGVCGDVCGLGGGGTSGSCFRGSAGVNGMLPVSVVL
jgi:hypothetical protein